MYEAKNYPFQTKSTNPKRWINWVFMHGESLAWYTGLTLRGFMPYLKFFGLTEADGASINDFRKLAEATAQAIQWSAKVCGLTKIMRGATLNLLSAETYPDHMIFVFPVFMRDKDRANITIKVYTDATHGGSVVLWCDPLIMSDIPSMAQFYTMVLRAADYATDQAKRFTVK